ncbi:solute carrier family 13 member 5-like [Tropilaelaps mercedesae]|uniref:Solute carrier family 13 member 5-like n=1 Tax=Tropilaelaps mercedesae TaxID=418985 RepID=A0A1V9WY92_9ACAR|nr:solute carrier family 13 member 5-like [Tropilaelaps mercedesae]
MRHSRSLSGSGGRRGLRTHPVGEDGRPSSRRYLTGSRVRLELFVFNDASPPEHSRLVGVHQFQRPGSNPGEVYSMEPPDENSDHQIKFASISADPGLHVRNERSKTRPALGAPRQRRTIWSETEELEEALDVHWCTSEVTCAPFPTSTASGSVGRGRPLGDGDVDTSDGKQPLQMGQPDQALVKPSLWARFWKTGVIVFAPLALSPLLIAVNTTESRCGFVVALMAMYWMTEALPLAVTALIPVILFPSLGIISSDETCQQYLVETNMVFVASLVMAIAIEHCSLHRRIALRVMLCVGTDPKWIMLGFMATTMFLSVWICNTSTTAMMMPIVDAVLAEILSTRGCAGPDDLELASSSQKSTEISLLEKGQCNGNSEKEMLAEQNVYSEYRDRQKRERRLAKGLYLSVAFAANIGGTATLTSAGPNLILKFIMDEYYHGIPPIDYASWIIFAAPGVIVTVLLVWGIFQLLYFWNRPLGLDVHGHAAKKTINKKYEELGPISFHEGAVLTLFACMVLLWMFRDPHFMHGWAHAFHYQKVGSCPPLITWQTIQQRLPWGVVLLRGGGFAMAEATKKSGLSAWMGHHLAAFNFLRPSWMAFAISSIVAMLTEFVTNSATATIFLPIVASLATDLRINPLYLVIPVTLACSYAFMLPVGTPANAIVATHARLKTTDMLLPGLIVKVISISTMLVSLNTLGRLIYSLDTFPDWALESVLSDGNVTADGAH